jgi:hypothetical protein
LARVETQVRVRVLAVCIQPDAGSDSIADGLADAGSDVGSDSISDGLSHRGADARPHGAADVFSEG